MGLTISQSGRSLRLLPISRCPPALRRQLSGRRSARAPGVDVMGVIGGPVLGQTRTVRMTEQPRPKLADALWRRVRTSGAATASDRGWPAELMRPIHPSRSSSRFTVREGPPAPYRLSHFDLEKTNAWHRRIAICHARFVCVVALA